MSRSLVFEAVKALANSLQGTSQWAVSVSMVGLLPWADVDLESSRGMLAP